MLIEAELQDITNPVEAMEPRLKLDHCLLEEYEEQISGLKSNLTDVSHSIINFNNDNSGLANKTSAISKVIFNTCLQIQQLLQMSTPASQQMIELAKKDVPTFKSMK